MLPSSPPSFSARSAVPSGLPSSTTSTPASGSASPDAAQDAVDVLRFVVRRQDDQDAHDGSLGDRDVGPSPPTTSNWASGDVDCHISRTITWIDPAMGMASNVPTNPPKNPPTRSPTLAPTKMAMRTRSGLIRTVLAHDDGVEDVVLDLGVREEDDGEDDEGAEGVGQGEEGRGDAGQGPADHGQEVEQRHPQRPQQGDRARPAPPR